MARTNTTEGQAVWQPGGAEEDSCFREGNRHLCLAYDDEEEDLDEEKKCCLKSQQQASVSQGRICSDNFTCCHTEIEAADSTCNLTHSQYTDTRQTSPRADPITPGAWQGSHCSANV